MNKHYCRTCATMEHVQGYRWQGGTVYLCDDCLRDFWQDIVSDVPENEDARRDSGAWWRKRHEQKRDL